ncbi:Basic secretory protease (Fragments) [Linum perenne]
MTTATSFIFQTFNQRRVTDRKDLRNVTVFIDQSSNHSLLPNCDDQFRIGVNYFSNLSSSAAAKREFAGIVHYYLTYAWAWNGRGKSPAGLISGTADYVRWKAGYGLERRFQGLVGERWDQGYEVTARFLDYCGGSRDGYFKTLMEKSVDELWSEYKRRVGNGRIHPFLHYF